MKPVFDLFTNFPTPKSNGMRVPVLSANDVDAINRLLRDELKPRMAGLATWSYLDDLQRKSYVAVLRYKGWNNAVVGMAELHPIPSCRGPFGSLHNLVVVKDFQSHGCGEMLVNALTDIAQRRSLLYIEATGSPERGEGIDRLFRRLKFENVKPTNVYRRVLLAAAETVAEPEEA